MVKLCHIHVLVYPGSIATLLNTQQTLPAGLSTLAKLSMFSRANRFPKHNVKFYTDSVIDNIFYISQWMKGRRTRHWSWKILKMLE